MPPFFPECAPVRKGSQFNAHTMEARIPPCYCKQHTTIAAARIIEDAAQRQRPKHLGHLFCYCRTRANVWGHLPFAQKLPSKLYPEGNEYKIPNEVHPISKGQHGKAVKYIP